MARRPISTASLSPALAAAAAAADAVDVQTDLTNRGGSTSAVLCQQPPQSVVAQRATLGLLLPVFQTSMLMSQTIASGYAAYIFGELTIAAGVTLTIESGGFMGISNFIYTS